VISLVHSIPQDSIASRRLVDFALIRKTNPFGNWRIFNNYRRERQESDISNHGPLARNR
jgi:hypothetical protein